MRIIFLLTLLVFSKFMDAQTLGGLPLKDIKVKYMQLVFTSKMLSSKVTVDIDYGQQVNVSNYDDIQLLDEKGNKIVFKSTVDGLNFMDAHGYEYMDAFVVTNGNQNVYHFLLKRKDP